MEANVKNRVQIVPFLHNVHEVFRGRTQGAELFRGWEHVLELERREAGRNKLLSSTHIKHATAIGLLVMDRDVKSVRETVLGLDIVPDPAALADIFKTSLEAIVYPDGEGPRAEDEWRRNVVLRQYAMKCGHNFRLECRNARLREEANTPEVIAQREGRFIAYATTSEQRDPGNDRIPTDAYEWGMLMTFVAAQQIVVAGLAKLPADRVPWALMALIRYTADRRNYAEELDRLRQIVTLVADIELSNA